MKTRILFLTASIGMILGVFAQNPTIKLTFTADNNGQHVPLNSILIENLTHGGDTTLYAPDTVLILDYVSGIDENNVIGGNAFSLIQNYPNPMKEKTKVKIYLPEREDVLIVITDIIGRELITREYQLERGTHAFIFKPGRESLYFLTARTDEQSQTIKMYNCPSYAAVSGICNLEYNGASDDAGAHKSGMSLNNFILNPDDQLQFTASSALGDRTIIDTPNGNTTYIFEYGSGGMPCPGTPTVTDLDGNIYNTVLINSQCWMKENLNVGALVDGGNYQTDNGVIEKYCYNNDTANCNTYGALYQWSEMMQYVTQQGTQGICPAGWHIPTDQEWKMLEGYVDSQYPIGDPIWDSKGFRGYDAGENLKAQNGWNDNGDGTNIFGFSALPGGMRRYNGSFGSMGDWAYFWSSTNTEEDANVILYRGINNNSSEVTRETQFEVLGRSVRCVKN